MRVLLVAPMMEGAKGRYIERALQAQGHDVHTFDDWNLGEQSYTLYANFKRVILAQRPNFRRFLMHRMNSLFLSAVREARPELILVIRGDTLTAETLLKAKKIGSPLLVDWFPDSILNPRIGNVAKIIACYDMFFMNDSYSIEILNRSGFRNISFLPQCCDPSVHHNLDLSDGDRQFFGSDVSYVGSITPLRVSLLTKLADYNLKIWVDRRWLKVPSTSPLARRIVYFRAFGIDQTRVFNASRVNLNPIQPAAVRSVNLRVFEIAGSGGFQLSEFREEVANYFKPGSEIVTYTTLDDLREKIDYYLSHDSERLAIAQRAQKRAHREHTYEKRIKEVLSRL